jgi:hypothetical protein
MKKKFFSVLLVLFLLGGGLFSQAVTDNPPRPGNVASPAGNAASLGSAGSTAGSLALKRLSLYSSGVGFFEHRGNVSASVPGAAEIVLPVKANAMNDALKSLHIALSGGAGGDGPSVTVAYPSEATLFHTLRSLKVNLLGNPGIAEILRALQGEEIEIAAPNPIKGRIISVEYRQGGFNFDNRNPANAEASSTEAFLSLYTAGTIAVINLKDIRTFAFTNQEISGDLSRALDLIMGTRNDESRELRINIPASLSRGEAALSYVIPVPVWKVSYRLDLSQKPPRLQGWAIIDNDSDTDWDNVELSLVSGRPVSFIQNLYAPYHVYRPTLPLAIAGAAEGRTYESGAFTGGAAEEYRSDEADDSGARNALMKRPAARASVSNSIVDTMIEYEAEPSPPVPAPMAAPPAAARGAASGDQFEFTLKQPVTIKRRQSAMVPLIESGITVQKVLVFSGSEAARAGGATSAALCAAITNTTGMKLPAGPITVYDGGAYAGDAGASYAGDALMEFLGDNGKRIISYGDDLTVTGSLRSSSSRRVSAVAVKAGLMTVTRSQSHETVYSLRNASRETRQLIIEHPISAGMTLTEPAAADERTDNFYRFAQTLAPGGELTFTVKEERPVLEQVALARTQLDSWLSYTANEAIPANVRAALEKAVELRRKVDGERTALTDLRGRLERLVSEQDRIRRNLEAAGNQSPQGQEYLRRLTAADAEIDALNTKIDEANAAVRAAERELDGYLASLSF